MVEKEIILDLSGKIKFSDTLYISLGTLILSVFVMIVQILICLAVHNWEFDVMCFTLLLDFVLAIREERKDTNINIIKEEKNNFKKGEKS